MPSARSLIAALVAVLLVATVAPAGAARRAQDPPQVSITSATAAVAAGAPTLITFTADQPGRYEVLYRQAAPAAAADFTVFPDAGAKGRAKEAGETSVGVNAPAEAGSYDIKVAFKATGDEAEATQANGLVVTGPPVAEADRCDRTDTAHCMLPFPNDRFTAASPTTDTGRLVNLSALSTPRNAAGKPVDPTEWNRNDGFSPGAMVMTMVPGLDLHQTWGTADLPFHHPADDGDLVYYDHRDHIADIDRYRQEDAPIVLLNTETGERHPFWSELDVNTATPAGETEASNVLILRPATNLEEGTRYVVALRDMRDASGDVIEAGAAFAGYRDGTATGARALQMEQVFADLNDAGIAREDLYLAWDFTVASERNLSERMLTIRDDAFAQLGDTDLGDGIVQGESPVFVIDSATEKNDSDIGRFREITGRVTVPNYLDRNQEQHETRDLPLPTQPPYNVVAPGSRLYDPDGDGKPEQNPVEPTLEATFTCRLPLDSTTFGGKVYPGLYGHGLLGRQTQVGDFDTPGMFGFAGCGADWIGMATEDLPNVAAILADISNFASLPDRAQQGFLNFMYIGRAMVHPDGFSSDPAWQDSNGEPLLFTATDTDTPLFYDGNSQGGIMGGSLVAVSPDIKRGILGVPGMNYSTLLNRSVDWEGAYGDVYYATYPDKLEQQLGFALIQMLWDRGEANGYAHHMTDDPLPNTPPHEVQLQVAWSDHQVTNHAAEVEARTIGAPIMVPGLDQAADHWEIDPFSDSETAAYPHHGSHLVYWDSGNRTPPNGNIPADQGGDPHGHARDEPAAAWQEAHFLLTGEAVDVCGGRSYLTDSHPLAGGQTYCQPPDRVPGS